MPVKKEEAAEEKSSIKKEIQENNDDSDEDSQSLDWWEQENILLPQKGDQRWSTLSHNGVLFPPEYVPHGIPVRYDGKPFYMKPQEEEVATMFAVMKESDYYHSPLFRQNFFRSWRAILDKRKEPHPIKRLELCDFEAIYQWHMREREKRLSRTKEEKKAIKKQQDEEAASFRWCLWNGKREKVANFRVEPPGLFRGRGEHPLQGSLKLRVRPEDITINIDEQSPIPSPPAGHQWKEVIHDNTVTWLAMWRDNIGGNFKYVMLAPSSTVKGQSDLLKFEKARSLKKHIDRIRESYSRDFHSKSLFEKQRAVATYFIDKLALRVGNEKSSDEADTVGCCTLRVEHITLLPDNKVKFDFLGKDSIRYVNEVDVLPEVYVLLQTFMQKKKKDEDLFDEVTPAQLNDHFKSFMDGLSAKVFRTYNASFTMDKFFKENPVNPKATTAEKVAYFNKVNVEVAILCNHQKSVSKSFPLQIHLLQQKIAQTKRILQILETVKEIRDKKGVELAANIFFEKVDEMQWEWLNVYGTEEERKEYAELVKNRSAPKAGPTKTKAAPKSKQGGGMPSTKKQSVSEAHRKKKNAKKMTSAGKSKTKQGVAKGSAAKTIVAKTKKVKKEVEESSEDDTTLAEMVAGSKRKNGEKRAERQARKRQRESDSELDVPLSSLI